MGESLNNIELITSVLQGDASEQEKQELYAWMQLSKENEEIFFGLKELYEAGKWETFKSEANTPQLWNQLKERIENTPEIELEAENPNPYLQFLKYAAIFCIGIFSFWLVGKFSKKTDENLKVQVVTGIGERSQVLLPDGTRVWVNSCSSFTYFSNYGKENRNVFLKGEAYFEVHKDKSMPFIVHSSGFHIRALGTSFNVSAYTDDDEVSAVLLEGSICFENKSSGESKGILPGQKIAYSKTTACTRVLNVNPEVYSAWSKGETQFEHLKLEEIIKRLQRTYNLTIILKNEKMKELYFSGTFRNYESFERILKVICVNTSLNYKIVKDTVYLK